MADDSSKRVTREDVQGVIFDLPIGVDVTFSRGYSAGIAAARIGFLDMLDALPATPAASETADAAWWHEQINGDPLLPDCSGTHLMGYGTCQRLAALSRSTPTPDATDAAYRRRPPEMRQTMLDRLLTMSGHQTAAQITPIDLEAFVNAQSNVTDEGNQKALLAAEEVDNCWTDQGDHIEWDADALPERLIALRRALAAPSTPTTEGLDVERLAGALHDLNERKSADGCDHHATDEYGLDMECAQDAKEVAAEYARLGERP